MLARYMCHLVFLLELFWLDRKICLLLYCKGIGGARYCNLLAFSTPLPLPELLAASNISGQAELICLSSPVIDTCHCGGIPSCVN